MSKHTFEIHIGDWSGDGHGHTKSYVFTASKPIDDVRVAYFAAKAKLPELCPESFCCEYEDKQVPGETWATLAKAGCPLPAETEYDDNHCPTPECMAKIVAWYCQQGDADLTIEYTPKSAMPALQFYGFDAHQRHIGFIGYGLMGS